MTGLLVAASRIRRSSTGIILTPPTAWGLATVFIMSLVLNITVIIFNAHLWHLPPLTYINIKYVS